MYFRWLFSDKKAKLVYWNRPSQVHLSSPFNYGSNITAHKTWLKLSIETHKKYKLGKEGDVANIAKYYFSVK